MEMLHQYREMYDYGNRLKTFGDWPFAENCSCTPEHMAKAGFVHSPTNNEPDVARCFFCLIELEGWEPDDDPWHEHAKRSATCGFLSMQKDFRALTVEEFLKLELERFKSCVVYKGQCNT
ncbi:baculoviral IAP repeat-containing protein 5.1-like [Lissotriton helveticus]